MNFLFQIEMRSSRHTVEPNPPDALDIQIRSPMGLRDFQAHFLKGRNLTSQVVEVMMIWNL
jgi:hypothetical protein